MTRITRIDGVPGAGKTYTLRQKLEAAKRDGLGMYDFYWLNFTNSGREDVEPEICDVFPDADDDPADRAKTLHGLALSLLSRQGIINPQTISDQIITHGGYGDDELDPFAVFCERRGMRYDPDAANPRKLLSGELTTDYNGNKLFAINDYLTQTCKSPDQWRDAPQDIRIASDRVPALLRAWRDYKHHAHDLRLFEHGDYVKLARDLGLSPGVDLLLIDEFQDFAALEYSLFKVWARAGTVEEIYISGDVNQSIYSFRGGTPHYFETTTTDDSIDLNESRRCPSNIADVGRSVLAAHERTDPRGFEGRSDGGVVGWPSITDKYGLRDALIATTDEYDSEPSALLLTRTNAQLRQLERDLMAVGVPFEVLGARGGVWKRDMVRLLSILNNLASDGQHFHWTNVKELLNALPDGKERRSAVGTRIGRVLDRDAVLRALDGFETPIGIVDHLQLDGWKRDVLRNALDAPASMKPNEVRAGTIHTAKGLEAPCVYLFTTTSDRTVKRYSRNDDHAAEEHRVYYVGATRASEELHLLSGYFDGPTAPPIQKIKRHGAVVA